MTTKREKAAEAVKSIQEHAKKHGLDRLTDAEIQREIDEARGEKLIARLTPHVDCDCLSCRPWTT